VPPLPMQIVAKAKAKARNRWSIWPRGMAVAHRRPDRAEEVVSYSHASGAAERRGFMADARCAPQL
jgi:hypothetical protein